MNLWKPGEGKRYLIFLLLFALVTLVIYAFSFLNLGTGLFSRSSSEETDPGRTSDVSETADDPETAAKIAACRELMTEYQQQLDSSFLIPADSAHPIPEDYDPQIVTVNQNPNLQLETTAAKALEEFLSAASEAGFVPRITSTYRTAKEQEKAFHAAVESYMQAGYSADKAREMATLDTGLPGTSEHQLGFAFDLNADSLTAVNDEGIVFGNYIITALPEYGFALSYPAGSEGATGHTASAVHYRYVGTTAAQVMTERQLTLIQYRDYLQTQIDYQQQQIEALKKK